MSRPASLRGHVRGRIGRLLVEAELDTTPGTLALVGPNGAGKSSLLAFLLGVRPVERGYMAVGDAVLLDTQAGVDIPLEQRGLGYVPQDYALFPHLSVRQNIEFALMSGPVPLDRSTRKERVAAILHDLGLEGHAERRTQTLSGGEKQRVALARALSVSPRALLLDEPLAALDVHSRGEVRVFLSAYLNRLALPTLVVTHDADDARQLAHRIAVLEAGKITQTGTWSELAERPASRFVEELVASAT